MIRALPLRPPTLALSTRFQAAQLVLPLAGKEIKLKGLEPVTVNPIQYHTGASFRDFTQTLVQALKSQAANQIFDPQFVQARHDADARIRRSEVEALEHSAIHYGRALLCEIPIHNSKNQLLDTLEVFHVRPKNDLSMPAYLFGLQSIKPMKNKFCLFYDPSGPAQAKKLERPTPFSNRELQNMNTYIVNGLQENQIPWNAIASYLAYQLSGKHGQ